MLSGGVALFTQSDALTDKKFHYWCYNILHEIRGPQEPQAGPGVEAGPLFLGNQLALDFLNTWLVPATEPVELLPDFKALLEWFQAAKLLTPAQAAELQSKWDGTSRAEKQTSRYSKWPNLQG